MDGGGHEDQGEDEHGAGGERGGGERSHGVETHGTGTERVQEMREGRSRNEQQTGTHTQTE